MEEQIMNIRIEFVKDGQVIKTFDRETLTMKTASALAMQIAKDSGIAHDSRNILRLRKFKANLMQGNKAIMGSMMESKAFDEAGAKALVENHAKASGNQYDDIHVVFQEGA
jgi:hypothetical protein